jgi:diaminohydroxyphosphoribosylaminopyrimidine deaminase / 5-amino-6-(5-phosphoribosylamino)uracil reductase
MTNGIDADLGALPAPMALALALAASHRDSTPPNPSVGCVITSVDGTELGRGHTQPTGGPHAEIQALRDAQARGNPVRGATAYVTLEPCSHQGRTGPCCDALAAAGIARVVAALEDPNPQVAGTGFARLRAAGVQVQVGPGAAAAREINLGFFSRMLRRTPWVRMKVAASLDGRTALDDGTSQWITSPHARADGHAWRARASALLTGIGTVREDDPQLDVRRPDCVRQPMLVVVDSRLETPPQARLFAPARPVLIYGAVRDAVREAALAAKGATVIHLPQATASARPKVDLAAMLADLATRECNEVHVEAGSKLNGSLLRAGLVDELLVYLAPRLIGQGRDMASLGPLARLADSLPLVFQSASMVGPDLRIVARGEGRDRF